MTVQALAAGCQLSHRKFYGVFFKSVVSPDKFEIKTLLHISLYKPALQARPVLHTVKILKFGTPQTIAIIVLKIEKFNVTLH